MTETRRERVRAATREEIKTIARRHMVEQGTAALSLRAIARDMGMTAPALYRYFPTRDDLITALILDGFNALADALEAAQVQSAAPTPAGQLFDVLLTYRQWAVKHPVDFQLIYGNPIPGYVAPREVTVPAVVRTFVVIIGLIEQAIQTGQLSLPSHISIPPALETHYRSLIERDNYPVSITAFHIAMTGWIRLHGSIMLELFNHIQATVGDAAVFYESQMQQLLSEFGLKTTV